MNNINAKIIFILLLILFSTWGNMTEGGEPEQKKYKCNLSKLDFDKNETIELVCNIPFEEDFPTIEEQIEHQLRSSPSAIKLIRFTDFDTFPAICSRFENVECLIFNNSIFDIPETVFDNLNSVEISIYMGAELNLFSSKPVWMEKVKKISLSKTLEKSIKSFNEIPNLEILILSDAAFDFFPEDINSLKQLNRIFIRNYYSYNPLNLSQIDFDKLPCLQDVYIENDFNSVIGYPKGEKCPSNVYISIK